MSIRVMTLVWETKLSSTEKLVLLYYADRAADDGSRVFPAIKTVATKTGLNERTVRRITSKLIIEGYLLRNGWSQYQTKLLSINLGKIHPRTQEQGEDSKYHEGGTLDTKREDVRAPKTSDPSNYPPRQKYPKKVANENNYQPLIDEEFQRALKRANQLN